MRNIYRKGTNKYYSKIFQEILLELIGLGITIIIVIIAFCLTEIFGG